MAHLLSEKTVIGDGAADGGRELRRAAEPHGCRANAQGGTRMASLLSAKPSPGLGGIRVLARCRVLFKHPGVWWGHMSHWWDRAPRQRLL